MKKRLDYKNTHFHNPLIQRHDLESQKENGMYLLEFRFMNILT